MCNGTGGNFVPFLTGAIVILHVGRKKGKLGFDILSMDKKYPIGELFVDTLDT